MKEKKQDEKNQQRGERNKMRFLIDLGFMFIYVEKKQLCSYCEQGE